MTTIKETLIYLNSNKVNLDDKTKLLNSLAQNKLEELYCDCVEYVFYDTLNKKDRYRYEVAKELLLQEFDRRE